MPTEIKTIRIAVLIFFCCAMLSTLSWAQVRYSSSSLAEKIYLQLDNEVYTNDQTIWFRAIVTNAQDHTLTQLSGVLYAELVSPDERVLERKLIKLDKGIGDGFFQLAQNYAAGVYLVRAYTEWNKNFGSDFFYNQYIKIFNADGRTKTNPIANLTLVEGARQRRLQVRFDPFTIDSSSGKEITVFLSFDEKKDTLSVKRNQRSDYLVDYPVPDKSRLVTLQIENDRNFSYSKTFLLDTSYLDVRFFPESGELVHGIPALLGLKALDHKGRGIPVKGEIMNRKGAVIGSFETNRLGMGSVLLNDVDSNENYTARVITAMDEIPKLYTLPAVAARGNNLSVRREGNSIALNVHSNYLMDDSVIIRASCRGAVYYDIKGRLRNGTLSFSLPASALPEGIIGFTLMVAQAKPVASRLYFNERPDSRLDIQIATDQQSYVQREETKLTIETKNKEGHPVPSSLSVMVINKSQLGKIVDHRQTILSYFLMSSDLGGEIENPGFYFSGDSNRYKDLDALLLTQGWQKYHYPRDSAQLVFQPETDLSISGTIKGGLFSNNEKKGVDLTMMTFGKPPSLQTQNSDSLGRFRFFLNEEYGQNLNILVQSKDKKGKLRPYTITLDRKEFPPVHFNHFLSAERPDSIVQAYVNKNIERKKAEDDFRIASTGHTMQEVIVKTYAMTPERKQVTDRYGKPATVIDGQAIRDKEAKWSYGLYSVLLFNFPDKINIVRARSGTLYARHFNREVTLVVIDGIPVRPEDYALIPGIPPSEVKSFEIIEYAKNFSGLYCEVFPLGCRDAPAWGNVIAIYTYAGKGIFGVKPAIGIMKTSVPVFSAPREFYAPKYKALEQDDWLRPDLRTLVHWEPGMVTDSAGKASASFYNGDNTGTMQIVVEAISANGEIGYREIFFEVKKRK